MCVRLVRPRSSVWQVANLVKRARPRGPGAACAGHSCLELLRSHSLIEFLVCSTCPDGKIPSNLARECIEDSSNAMMALEEENAQLRANNTQLQTDITDLQTDNTELNTTLTTLQDQVQAPTRCDAARPLSA